MILTTTKPVLVDISTSQGTTLFTAVHLMTGEAVQLFFDQNTTQFLIEALVEAKTDFLFYTEIDYQEGFIIRKTVAPGGFNYITFDFVDIGTQKAVNVVLEPAEQKTFLKALQELVNGE